MVICGPQSRNRSHVSSITHDDQPDPTSISRFGATYRSMQ